MSDWRGRKYMSSVERNGKRPSRQLPDSSSDSDSDISLAKSNKRKRIRRVVSDSESSSSSSSLFQSKSVRKRTPRVMSDANNSSENDGEIPLVLRGGRKKVPRVVNDESTSSESNSSGEESENDIEDGSDESGLDSSSGSYESGAYSDTAASDSNWETDWQSEQEEDVQQALQESLSSSKSAAASTTKDQQENHKTALAIAAPAAATSAGFMSDSSDGQSEKCPICLLTFTSQEIGTPESCDHSFCAVCLQEWSKNMNTCPVDRQTFSLILVRRHFEGKVIRKVPVEVRQLRDDAEEQEEDPTFCEVCGRSDREDRLLLCDGCDLGYHLECLNPPMETVPVEEWFCQDCILNNTNIADEVDFQEGELIDLIDDAHRMGLGTIRPRTSRLLPRTRQSERVRATIMSLQRADPAMQPSTSSGIESLGTESTASVGSGQKRRAITTTTVPRRRRKGVRRKGVKKLRKRHTTRTCTKTKKKSGTKSSSAKCVDGSKPKTKRRRMRKIRRRKKKISRRRTPRVVMPLSVKARLAEQLGMCPPNRPGLTLPVVRGRPASDIDLQRSRAGIPTLHLFGQRDQLDYFSGSDHEGEGDEGGVAVALRPHNSGLCSSRLLASRKLLSASAVRSHTAISNPRRRANLVVQGSGDSMAQSPCDLIGSILDSQSIWHSKKAKVTISRDGSLEVKKDTNNRETAKKGAECSGATGGTSKNDGNPPLIRNDNRQSVVAEKSSLPLNLGDASGQTTQTPLYPGRDGSGSRPPPGGSGFHQFGGNRYSSSSNNSSASYQNYQGGRGYSNFSPTSSFDAHSTRAGYANYLNSGPPLPFRGSPMRFRLSPRFPLRRPPGPPPRLPVPLLKPEEKAEDNGEGNQNPQDEEEDEIDIYSDIELGGVGSGGPSGGGSEPDEADRSMDVSYEALPPPPEPSALLMGIGEQALSDEEPASDSELVIDDNVVATSPHEQSDNTTQIPDSEKYDPAEPSYDSDEELPLPAACSVLSNEDIPLPSGPIVSNTPPRSTAINSSSNSNISYLHSPSYGDNSAFESEKKLSSVATDGVVNQAVKEVLKERLGSALTRRHVSADADEEEGEECPNFSIYSALSMDIARRTGEDEEQSKEQADTEEKGDMSTDENVDENVNETVAKEVEEHSPTQEEEKDDGCEGVAGNKESDVEEDLMNSGCDDQGSEKLSELESHGKEGGDIEQVIGELTDSDKPIPTEPTNEQESTIEVFNELTLSTKVSDEPEQCDDLPNDNLADNNEQCHSPNELAEHADIDMDAVANGKMKSQELVEEIFGSDDNDSLIGGATSAVSAATIDNNLPVSTPLGLEGLDTETISETEEAINFDDDLSQDGNGFLTAEEDGEIPSVKRKKKKKSRKLAGAMGKDGADLEADSEMSPPEAIDYEEGEIVDDRPKTQDIAKKDKKLVEKKDKARHDKEGLKSSDENFDISKPKSVVEEEKKKKKKKSGEKGRSSRERTVLGSSENKEKNREKARRSEENISWKKPSKSSKVRNYRDGKATKADDAISKDKEADRKGSGAKEVSSKKDKKRKEKRKDMERYDVRKVVSDKKRKRRDEFGRDLSRDRSYSRSRSRSRRRSRDRSRQRSRSLSRTKSNRAKVRSPVRSRVNRSRSRSRVRSRSRSRNRTRSRSRNKSNRKSKERLRKSRSKERLRVRVSRSHSRGKRSRTRSRSRSKNRQRVRSRSRSVVRSRERKERTRAVKEAQRFRVRRSWSRTWTPSWSRSRSRSVSCSSYSRSRTPSVRHFNHSYTRSFSRSWSRERHERIPVLEKKTMSKAPKKLTVIVSNTKDDTERQRKKEKKRKENRKNKEPVVAVEKRKKRKEKSPAPSKEVFTSGDNILVSVNFNKSNKTSAMKDVPSASLSTVPKDTSKRKRDDTFEPDRETGKKVRKEKVPKDKGSPRLKGAANTEKAALRSLGEKKSKKQSAKGNKSARMAAILKQKPVAIIDLDQSPFHEQTPSPTDLIVLSDSDDEVGNKEGEMEEMVESLSSRRGIRPNSASPQTSSKVVHNVATSISATRTPESQSPLMSAISSYLVTSTGPKTPPEPQVKFSIAAKPQLRSINNPLREEEDDMLAEDTGLDDSDQRIEEELDRGLVDIVHKGPNTPPEPRGPSTPCSPPTSPDAYDPFDPTKSGTPSPVGPEASMDGPPSPTRTPTEEHVVGGGGAAAGGGRDSTMASDLEDMVNKTVEARSKTPTLLSGEEITEERSQSPDRTKSTSRVDSILTKSPSGMPESTSVISQLPSDELSLSADISEGLDKTKSKSSLGLPSNVSSVVVSESNSKSPERKITVVITSQPPKMQGTPVKQQIFPVTSMKQIPASQPVTSTPSHSSAPAPLFPTLTPANIASILCTPPANLSLGRTNLFNTPAPISVPPLLQHHHMANSPAMAPARISAEKAQTRMPSEKAPGSVLPLRSMVQNGEQKQPQDTTTEVVDMDLDSPYSPGSSEGDDLFDPPLENSGKSNQQSYSADRNRSAQQNAKNSNKLFGLPLATLTIHKSPSKPFQDKFDNIFGVSPLRFAKQGAAAAARTSGRQTKGHHKAAKGKGGKHGKGGRKEIAIKMDEDQLQILDDLPSSAVELQVKDKFLKKLNRQERVVEEVKVSLKPHYTKKHITKEEYKDILRRSVPKICHNRSGEINPIKISTLVEAYVKKTRYAKKKTTGAGAGAPPSKAKVMKTTMWS